MLIDLLTAHDLSVRQLAKICSKIPALSARNLYRLVNGEASTKLIEAAQKTLPKLLKPYLAGRGLSDAEIAAALAPLDQLNTQLEEPEMLTSRCTLPPVVADFFGLRRDPFTGEPRSAEEVFTTRKLDDIFEQVKDAINYQGFVAVLGDIGAGKSVLKRRVCEAVEKSEGRQRVVWPEFFDMSRVRAGSIATALLHAFDQKSPADLVARRTKLDRILRDLSAESTRVALGFDECHHLSDTTLTALKNFWEMGTGGYTRYLGVVLFGQPKFEARLRDERFREIAERVEIIRMPTLEKTGWDYLKHRLAQAGGNIEKLFERDAVAAMIRQAKTPLALGNLANAALLANYATGDKLVSKASIKDAAGEAKVVGVRQSA